MSDPTPAGDPRSAESVPGANAPIDVTAWIGGYPYPRGAASRSGHLVRVLDREGFGGAWVGHLPGAFHRDPVPSNRALYAALRPHRAVLQPAPMVRPDWPGWEQQLRDGAGRGRAGRSRVSGAVGLVVTAPGAGRTGGRLRQLGAGDPRDAALRGPSSAAPSGQRARRVGGDTACHAASVARGSATAELGRDSRGGRRRSRSARGNALGTHPCRTGSGLL